MEIVPSTWWRDCLAVKTELCFNHIPLHMRETKVFKKDAAQPPTFWLPSSNNLNGWPHCNCTVQWVRGWMSRWNSREQKFLRRLEAGPVFSKPPVWPHPCISESALILHRTRNQRNPVLLPIYLLKVQIPWTAVLFVIPVRKLLQRTENENPARNLQSLRQKTVWVTWVCVKSGIGSVRKQLTLVPAAPNFFEQMI